MTKRQRTLLFSTLLGLFFILAPTLALYSQGYRIDFAGGRIAQTGAFYFKVAPARADILVDGTFVKKTDFLFGSGLTKNFFPDNYFLEVTKYSQFTHMITLHSHSVISSSTRVPVV